MLFVNTNSFDQVKFENLNPDFNFGFERTF